MSDETMLIFFNSLSLNNHTQILQTELHRVPLEFDKDQNLFPLVSIVLIPIISLLY